MDTIKKLDKVDGATKSTMLAGSRIHKGYKTDYRDTSKWRKEMAVGRKRIDFMDKEKNTIYELKPMNVNGLKNGIKQLKKYQKAIGKRSGMVLELY